jgi:hypothetical protein
MSRKGSEAQATHDPRLQFFSAANGAGKLVTEVYSEERSSVKIQLIGRQNDHRKAILNADVNITYGPAGTGKTFVPVATAIELMCREDSSIRNMIYIRPAVIAGGKTPPPVPGSVGAKNAYLLSPLLNVIEKTLDKNTSQRIINDLNNGNTSTGSQSKFKDGAIRFEPLGFQRGDTFDDTIIIVDEAGSASQLELELLLGRLGMNSKICFVGDRAQKDIPQPSRTVAEFAEISRALFAPIYSAMNIDEEKLAGNDATIQGIIDRYSKQPLSAFENMIINARSHYDSACSVFEYTDADIVRSPVIGRVSGKLFPQVAVDNERFHERIKEAKRLASGIQPA